MWLWISHSRAVGESGRGTSVGLDVRHQRGTETLALPSHASRRTKAIQVPDALYVPNYPVWSEEAELRLHHVRLGQKQEQRVQRQREDISQI